MWAHSVCDGRSSTCGIINRHMSIRNKRYSHCRMTHSRWTVADKQISEHNPWKKSYLPARREDFFFSYEKSVLNESNRSNRSGENELTLLFCGQLIRFQPSACEFSSVFWIEIRQTHSELRIMETEYFPMFICSYFLSHARILRLFCCCCCGWCKCISVPVTYTASFIAIPLRNDPTHYRNFTFKLKFFQLPAAIRQCNWCNVVNTISRCGKQ